MDLGHGGTLPRQCTELLRNCPGGAGGTRTPYLILAKDALSLMSYSPTSRGREV